MNNWYNFSYFFIFLFLQEDMWKRGKPSNSHIVVAISAAKWCDDVAVVLHSVMKIVNQWEEEEEREKKRELPIIPEERKRENISALSLKKTCISFQYFCILFYFFFHFVLIITQWKEMAQALARNDSQTKAQWQRVDE